MNSMMVMFLVIALGYLLGRITIRGLNLGTSGIILIALVFGHFGYSIPKEIQNLGLICFVTAVGYIAGPVFFRNFKEGALSYLILGAVIIVCSAAICVGSILLLNIPTALATGLVCGALTSTPGLAAAIAAGGQNMASVGYGIGYPFGVLGVVLFVQLVPKLLKADLVRERNLLAANVPQKTAAASAVNNQKLAIDPFGFACFAAAVVVGQLIGDLQIPMPGGGIFSLGISGGPLLSGLLAGHIGHIGTISTSVPKTTLNAMREFGLSLFLMGAGLAAGDGFVAILKDYGIGLFLIGIIMTLFPMVVGYLLASKVFRLSLLNTLGSICGGMTSTPALGSLIEVSQTDLVAASYAATYPVALIFVILAVQLIYLLLGHI